MYNDGDINRLGVLVVAFAGHDEKTSLNLDYGLKTKCSVILTERLTLTESGRQS